jgi:hypothetical protein
MGPSTFAHVTAVRPLGTDAFAADLDPEWTIAGKPNGGYLLAVLARAAVASCPHDHPIAASAHYLHAPGPGPVELAVELLRAGRGASQVRVRMTQDDKACVEALFTVSRLERGVRPYWNDGVPRVAAADRDAAVRVPGRTPAGIPAAIMEQVDLRIDPAALGFASGRPSGRGELTGWLALPDDAAFDPVSLLYAVDAFPPATFDIEMSGWVPTLELTVYVRGLPAPGPVRVLQKAQLIEAQRVDEQCWVWDSAGRPVAQGTQLAGIRLG